jgi:Zn-dependent peptidase ImmA (M78 family)/transcriptional regulator with XRE-family HTH domain
MENKLNAEMLILAREYRGLTQGEVAAKTGFAQAKIAKIEGGMQTEVPAEEVACFARALDFPIDFFFQNEERIGYGSSAYYYRKKADLTAQDRKKIHGLVNLLRINIKHLLSSVDVESKRRLPKFNLDDFGGSPQKLAGALRAFWQLPDGPVKDATKTIEAAGVIVLPCKFGTRAMDATSLWLAEMPPLIFVNENLPGDRWRFTLCHELAHLIAHDVPCESMEDEADSFAAEFLMPEGEIRAHFHRMQPLRIPDLVNLKAYWKVSMAALVERAHDLGFLTDNQRRHTYIVMSKLGYRSKDRATEPNPIPREQPTSHQGLMRLYETDLGYSREELAKLLRINLPELKVLHGVYEMGAHSGGRQRPRFEIVR